MGNGTGLEGYGREASSRIREWFKRVGKDTLWGAGGGAIIGALFGAPVLGAGIGGIIGLIGGAVRHK